MGRRSSIVIIAEGARDIRGAPITSEHVKQHLDKAGFDCRITILGHVQRGGSPSVLDRNNVSFICDPSQLILFSEYSTRSESSRISIVR